MKAKWLIESLVFEENETELLASLAKYDIIYKSLDEEEEQKLKEGLLYASFPSNEFRNMKKNYLDFFDDDDCVVIRGSIQFCDMIRKEAKWIPGVYCNWDAFRCINYYPKFKSELLNGDEYMILPYGDLLRQKEFIFKTFGQSNTVFIRPDAGNKIFTGQAVQKEHFERDLETLGFYDVPDNELCIITYPVNVVAEYRFVVVGDKVIAGSEYRPTRKEIANGGDAVWAYAQEVVDSLDYSPDRVWSLDVCRTKSGRTKVLEIGSFSCAGMYMCNNDAIVEHVSRAAVDEWEEYRVPDMVNDVVFEDCNTGRIASDRYREDKSY